MEIQKAVKLKNARDREKVDEFNKTIEEKEKMKVYSRFREFDLAKAIYPNQSDKAKVVNMSKLKNSIKRIKLEWIEIICEKTETDPNFLFGFPSEHDKDYQRLIK